MRQSYISKTKNGEFLCGCPPFGFVKPSSGGNRLEIDGEAADTVRRIFAMACEGKTNTQIAIALNNDSVDTPLMYRKRKGRTLRGAHSAAAERVFWTSESVRKIIIDERYTGVMVSGKKRVVSPGSRRRDYLPESEWIRIPGSHEAIVSEDVFKQANANIIHRKIVSPVKNRSLYSGKIKCGCCGRSMEYSASKNPYYSCDGAKFSGGMGCFDGRLHLSVLSEIVLETVKVEAQKVFDALRKRNQQANRLPNKSEINAELKKLAARMNLLERRGIELFEDFADGKIDKDSYLEGIEANGVELQKSQIRIDELHVLAVTKSNKPVDKMEDESFMQRIMNTKTITDEVLSLIDRILIFDNDRIEIRFAFKDTNITEV